MIIKVDHQMVTAYQVLQELVMIFIRKTNFYKEQNGIVKERDFVYLKNLKNFKQVCVLNVQRCKILIILIIQICKLF